MIYGSLNSTGTDLGSKGQKLEKEVQSGSNRAILLEARHVDHA